MASRSFPDTELPYSINIMIPSNLPLFRPGDMDPLVIGDFRVRHYLNGYFFV